MFDELWLIHPSAEMCAAFQKRFANLPQVQILQTNFEDLPPHDCFVTAGNSYGIMTAGIDASVVRYFGVDLMERVQLQIMNEFYGEQPVGTAFIVPTHHQSIPFVCHAPTMRTPGSIAGTDKVYNATWAALLAALSHNRQSTHKIRTLAFPALGTGFGSVSYDECARQMAAAYRHLYEPPHRFNWDFVIARELSICYDNGQKVIA
jgi:O-acetyl-ADP-ribose deacetylase (regulator of RNase III)